VAYELFVSNFERVPVAITALTITGMKDGQATFTTTIEDRGAAKDLTNMFSIAGPPTLPQEPVLQPGQGGILYVLLDFAFDSGPRRLTHTIEVQVPGDPRTVQTIQAAQDVLVGRTEPMLVSAPLRGTHWWTANGPSNFSRHRRIFVVIDGQPRLVEKYAVDWAILGDNGDTFSGDAKENASYFAYRRDILAVADGDIVSIKNDLPENVPGEPPVVPITVETLGGNYVVQDLGKGRFAFYAHLIPGSIAVKPGDRVRRGEVLGHLGNSGNSTEPHLHFHLMDGPDPLRSNSVPFHLDEFTRHEYAIVCEQPGQCQIVCVTPEQCIPIDGPRALVITSSHVVHQQTFMDFDLGDFTPQ
jgi:hypothetical protein